MFRYAVKAHQEHGALAVALPVLLHLTGQRLDV